MIVLSEQSLNLWSATAGFVLGFMSFVITETLRRWADRRDTRKRILSNLLTEMRQNRKHLDISTYMSLQTQAWDEAKSTGISMKLPSELRDSLITLYGRIIEKNELLNLYRLTLPSGQELSIVDASGQKPVPLNKIIAELSLNLRSALDEIIPRIQRELDP